MDGCSKILCTILLKFLSFDHSSFPNDISLTVLGRPASVTLLVLITKEVKAGIGAILGLVSLVRLADLYAKRSENLLPAHDQQNSKNNFPYPAAIHQGMFLYFGL